MSVQLSHSKLITEVFLQRGRFAYLSVFPVQVSVVLLHSAEFVLGLLELCLPGLDLLILPGHLQQGLHLVSATQRSEVSVEDISFPARPRFLLLFH